MITCKCNNLTEIRGYSNLFFLNEREKKKKKDIKFKYTNYNTRRVKKFQARRGRRREKRKWNGKVMKTEVACVGKVCFDRAQE